MPQTLDGLHHIYAVACDLEKLALKRQASRPQIDEQLPFSIVAEMPSGPDAVLCLRRLMAFITSMQSHVISKN